MTSEEKDLLAIVDSAASGDVGMPAYQKLVNLIANRVAQEFGLAEQGFDLADAALREADCGPDGEAYFVLYENLLREKHAVALKHAQSICDLLQSALAAMPDKDGKMSVEEVMVVLAIMRREIEAESCQMGKDKAFAAREADGRS